ncbi:MAG: hypothetical protein OEV69_06780, partial [Gammaproteobacteria bacterium]|nr:hypothetical protein [Gammaproteobacteria bacterium]
MTASAAPSGVLTGAVESVAAATWRIDGLEFELFLSESGLAASTRIAQISLLESGQKFDDIVVACERIAMSSVAISCQAATFAATLPAVGRQTVRGSFVHARRDSVTDVVLENVAIAAGIARIEIRATDDELDVRFSSPELQLDGLLDAAIALGAELSDYTAAGTTALTGRLRTLAGGGLRIELVTQFSGTSISNNAGTIAAEGLAGKLLLDLTEHGDVLQFDLEIESNSGEAYLEP